MNVAKLFEPSSRAFGPQAFNIAVFLDLEATKIPKDILFQTNLFRH